MNRLIKWLLAGSALLMLLLVVIVIALLAGGPRVKGNSILLVTLDGPLLETSETDIFAALTGDEAMVLRELTDAIRYAAEDKRIAGLLLQVKTGGVGFAQLQEIEDAMATFRASKKWSAAHLETAGEFSQGAGAFALAACADRVLLSPPGDINLVGLRSEVPFLKGLFDKLQLDVHFGQRHEYKNTANMFTKTEMTPAHLEATKALIDDLELLLVEHISARRGVTIDVAREWMSSGPHLATAALEGGMVDALSYWDEALAEAEKAAGDEQDSLLELGKYMASVERHDAGPKVALIYGDGGVARGESAGGSSPAMGSDTVTAAFRDARKEEVEGVLFRVDSPGGSYVASDLIRREVEVTRDAGIPVVVSMGNVAASGGYFVAMHADRIVAQSGTITGSIGVFAGMFGTRRFWNHWLGVTFDSYETAPNGAMFSSLDLPDEASKKRLDAFLDRIYDDFVGKAATGRKMEYDQLEALARGRVWSGRAAKAHGLIDELGGFERSLEVLKEVMGVPAAKDVELVMFPQPKSPFEMLAEQFGSSVQLMRLANDGRVALTRLGQPGALHAPVPQPKL